MSRDEVRDALAVLQDRRIPVRRGNPIADIIRTTIGRFWFGEWDVPEVQEDLKGAVAALINFRREERARALTEAAHAPEFHDSTLTPSEIEERLLARAAAERKGGSTDGASG